MKNFKTSNQTGFTLIELMAVVICLGILIAVLVPGSKDASNPATATALQRAADQINSTIGLIARRCGVSTAVTGNPLPATGKTWLDVVFGGATNVATSYQSCYKTSQATVLSELGQSNGAGGYEVRNYAVTLADGGSSPLKVSFAAVPDSIVYLLAQSYTPTLSTLASSDTTSQVIQYGAASGEQRTVTVLKQQ